MGNTMESMVAVNPKEVNIDDVGVLYSFTTNEPEKLVEALNKIIGTEKYGKELKTYFEEFYEQLNAFVKPLQDYVDLKDEIPRLIKEQLKDILAIIGQDDYSKKLEKMQGGLQNYIWTNLAQLITDGFKSLKADLDTLSSKLDRIEERITYGTPEQIINAIKDIVKRPHQAEEDTVCQYCYSVNSKGENGNEPCSICGNIAIERGGNFSHRIYENGLLVCLPTNRNNAYINDIAYDLSEDERECVTTILISNEINIIHRGSCNTPRNTSLIKLFPNLKQFSFMKKVAGNGYELGEGLFEGVGDCSDINNLPIKFYGMRYVGSIGEGCFSNNDIELMSYETFLSKIGIRNDLHMNIKSYFEVKR